VKTSITYLVPRESTGMELFEMFRRLRCMRVNILEDFALMLELCSLKHLNDGRAIG